MSEEIHDCFNIDIKFRYFDLASQLSVIGTFGVKSYG